MPRGRPPIHKYPPRIDATMEELVQAGFSGPPPKGKVVPETYRCVDCGREVYYPEILYRDGRGECCHTA